MKYISLFLLSLAFLVNESLAQVKTVTVNSSNVMVFPAPDTFRISNPVSIGVKYWVDTASLNAGVADFDGQIQVAGDQAVSLYSSAIGGMTPEVRILNASVTVDHLSSRGGAIALGVSPAIYPNIVRNANSVYFRLSDNSDFVSTQSLYDRFGSTSPEGIVNAPIGTIYHNTAGGVGTSVYQKQPGTINTGWRAIGLDIKHWVDGTTLQAGVADFIGQIQVANDGNISLFSDPATTTHPSIAIVNDFVSVKKLISSGDINSNTIGVVGTGNFYFGLPGNPSYPALYRNATGLQIKLADASAFTSVQSLYDRFGAGSPEGAVTAPAGAIYHNTSGGAATSVYVKETGAGNTGWVGK